MQKVIQQQQAGLERLTNILGSNILVHHAKKWVSILAETVLYLLFICMLVLIVLIPNSLTIPLEEYKDLSLEIKIKEMQEGILILKLFLVLLLCPLLLFARLLSRNRKKKELIKQAFEEVKAMKNRLLPYLME